MKDSSCPSRECDKTPHTLQKQAFATLLPNRQMTLAEIARLLSKLPKFIKEPLRRPAADFKESGVSDMTVTVSERDDAHISHESIADGIQIFEVRQQDQLVGLFHHESDAQRYASELAEQEAKKMASNT
jgi:hypothetical protein